MMNVLCCRYTQQHHQKRCSGVADHCKCWRHRRRKSARSLDQRLCRRAKTSALYAKPKTKSSGATGQLKLVKKATSTEGGSGGGCDMTDRRRRRSAAWHSCARPNCSVATESSYTHLILALCCCFSYLAAAVVVVAIAINKPQS